MHHTFEQQKELITLVITLIGAQILNIVVVAINAWLAHSRHRATKNDHEQIVSEVKKINGNGGGH